MGNNLPLYKAPMAHTLLCVCVCVCVYVCVCVCRSAVWGHGWSLRDHFISDSQLIQEPELQSPLQISVMDASE